MIAWKRCTLLFFLTVLLGLDSGCGGGTASTMQTPGNPGPTPTPTATPTPTPSPTPTPTPTPQVHFVSISWQASTSSGIVSYNIYRSTASGGPYTKAGRAAGTSFTDRAVQAGTTYFYVVSAVNNSGVESPASPEQSVTVPN